MVQALIFDVFGTCVDWRNSVAVQVRMRVPGVDPFAFADGWRAAYDPAMAPIRLGERGYTPLDQLHLENLRRVAGQFGVEVPDSLNRAWERLDPWPDVVAGLRAMKRSRIIAPCSNGSIAMMTRLARHGELPWDCILGADIARSYKPDQAVYAAACEALQLRPDQVMMVAAHNNDLAAAAACGLATGFVSRPTEHGPDQATGFVPTGDWTLVADDFLDLARQLT